MRIISSKGTTVGGSIEHSRNRKEHSILYPKTKKDICVTQWEKKGQTTKEVILGS